MARSSMWRAILVADRQQRAEPLLGKGGRAKHGLWHRRRPAARYAQVLREAQSLWGSMAGTAGFLHANQLPLFILGTPGDVHGFGSGKDACSRREV